MALRVVLLWKNNSDNLKMEDKIKLVLEFQSRKLNILSKHGLLGDLLQQQADGSGGYTDDGEDLFYNLLYSMDQDLRKTRRELEERRMEFNESDYKKMAESLEEQIRGTGQSLNVLLEEMPK